MGLELFVPEAHRLPTLTAVCVPQGVNEAKAGAGTEAADRVFREAEHLAVTHF
jgi:aspartate aminotransferase-like enzyme